MFTLKTVETKLNDVFKGLPSVSENGKESLVKAWPWIALIFGLLQLLAAWGLWSLIRSAQKLVDLANTLSAYYTTAKPTGLSTMNKMAIYLGIIMLVVDGIILLMAYPHLKTRSRKGWDLLFIGALLNVIYSVVELFINGRGFASFIFSLLGSAVGFYLLFQVRDKYKDSSTRNPKIAS